MPARQRSRAPRESADTRVEGQLERILASATFRPVDRLKRFLKFVVQETIAGRGDRLKEYVIGVHVFDKEQSFDPRADPIVRVQARRLRARVVRYYREEARPDELVIDLPKGRYSPAFKPAPAPSTPKRSITAALLNQNTVAVLPFADHSPAGDLGYFCSGLPGSDPWPGRDPDTAGARLGCRGTGAGRGSAPGGPVGSCRDGHHGQRAPVGRAAPRDHASRRRREPRTPGRRPSIRRPPISPRRRRSRTPSSTSCNRTARPAPSAAVVWPRNLAARNLYLQGRYHLNQRTEESLRKAVEFFERAIVEDSQYALAHSGLADGHGLLAHYGVSGPAEVWTKAASSGATAVMLDPGSAEAHTSLAHVKSTQDWDWQGAEREFQLAISLDPAYATAHHWYAMSCLVPLGRLDEALDEMLMAQSLDPVSSIVARDLALVHLFRHEPEAALEQSDHTIELNPHFSPAYWALGVIQEQRKDFDEAAAAFQRAIHLSPQTPRLQAALGRTHALAGKRKEALETVRRLETLAAQRYVSPFEFASMRFALGQPTSVSAGSTKPARTAVSSCCGCASIRGWIRSETSGGSRRSRNRWVWCSDRL